MDAKRTMIEAYRHGMRFGLTTCGDPECSNCGEAAVEVSAGTIRPDEGLLDALACHHETIVALLKLDVYRETRH